MKLFLALLTLVSLNSYADFDSFYSKQEIQLIHSTKLDQHELKSLLRDVESKRHSKISYKAARRILYTNVYLTEDAYGNPYVLDVYCENEIRNVSNTNMPSGTKTNIEHTWPQSKFNRAYSKSMQKSDLHHLFITNSKANSRRGNLFFGEVDSYGHTPGLCQSSGFGTLVQPPSHVEWSSNDFFEPPRAHRGNVARALFYFAIRYDLEINDTEEYFLRKWHEEDPVEEIDVVRNGRIEEIQGNRNPFIDFPELVDRIRNF